MGQQRKSATVQFRRTVGLPERVTFEIEPEERIVIVGENGTTEPIVRLLRHPSERIQYVEEYKALFAAAIDGDQRLFVGQDEVRAMWHFTDYLIRTWRENTVPLITYAPDSRIVKSGIE